MPLALTAFYAPSRSSSVTASSGVMTRYFALAGMAAAGDLLTKALAASVLTEGHMIALTKRVAFMLVYNTGSAGGVMIGPFTWALNVMVTLAAILMVMRIVTPMAAVDTRATLALALVSGGAFGNLASMVAGPEGVADFFAVGLTQSTTIVMNVADLMLWSGALLLVPVVLRLIGTMRTERAPLV
jgi:lipoprotein signal peptidase